MELDALDKLGASAFEGYLVRKDLVRKYSRQYPVPTYVVETESGEFYIILKPQDILFLKNLTTGLVLWQREKGSPFFPDEKVKE